jgi:MFS family permease
MVTPWNKTEAVSDSTALEDEKFDIACHEDSVGSEYPTINDKKLLRRIDLHVVAWLATLYAFSLLDRTNIGSAKVAGMEVDLELTGNRYSIVSLMLFPTYILLEVPSNMLIRRISVRRYLAGAVFCWGVLAMCCGFVNDWKELIAVRVLLGAFEGAFQVSLGSLHLSYERRD